MVSRECATEEEINQMLRDLFNFHPFQSKTV
jgi:hypothetical protein